MGFTPAQSEAIHARNRELLVSAAAGSGKTRVLIERIFTLLAEDGLSLDRLLIVTFTHAAAAEMRERLQQRIADAAIDQPAMRKQAQLLETAQISTLHSFCQRIVKEYFQEVDIDPQSMLGDEAMAANLRKQAKDEAIEWLYAQAEENDADCKALADKFEDKQIDKMVGDVYPFLMALPDPFHWMSEIATKLYTEDDLATGEMAQTLLMDCRLLASGAEELSKQSIALSHDPLFHEKYIATAKSDQANIEALTSAAQEGLLALIAVARQFSLDRLPSVRNLEGEEATLRDQFKTNRESIKKLAKAIADHLPEDAQASIARMNAMQPALRGLCLLMQQMDTRYSDLKRERILIDFHDLERMTLRILANPAIREEVSARYDGIFVDEYQDISGVQEAILNAVKRNVSRETSGHPQRFFYVGDVKQSIYRFRQADPSLFMNKARTFLNDENAVHRRISLNANFRSRETVLASVNRVFEQVMRADVTEIEYDDEARLYPGIPSVNDPQTSLHLITQPVKAAQKAKLQAYAIGCEIRRRIGEPITDRDGNQIGKLSYKDIAILAPKMKDVGNVLERTLGEMGIPVYCEDRGSSMESEEISQTLNHLRLMDNIADDLALLASLRSPVIGMDDRQLAEVRLRQAKGSYLEAVRAVAQDTDVLGLHCARALAQLTHERFLLKQTPLHEYLWGWLTRSGLYAFYGCQSNGKLRQANLRMLCEKAGEHVKRRGGELRDFLNSVEAQTGVRSGDSPTVLSPWEDVVRVMTIHKSKGLEFPVVFVMGLDETFSSRRSSALTAHPRLGIALPYINEKARTTGDTILKAAIDLRSQSEEKAERARLLYVAMTRAKDELILMGCGNQLAPEDAADGFRKNNEKSAYAVFGANSMLSWICSCADETDTVEVWEQNELMHNPVRINASENELSTKPTIYPQKSGGWRIVFHIGEEELENAMRYAKGKKGLTELELRRARLQALAENARAMAEELRWVGPDGIPEYRPADEAAGFADSAAAPQPLPDAYPLEAAADPLAPLLRFSHHPFKVGVTALVRADAQAKAETPFLLDTEEGDAGALESADVKRLPLPMTRPRMMSDLPSIPAFMRPPAEQTGVRKGVATHKALSLLNMDALRKVSGDTASLQSEVQAQIAAMEAQRKLTPEEAPLVSLAPIVAFWQSETGRSALTAETIHREWSFNLRLPERDDVIVQGVIDLCYLQQKEWVLVDYKTDRVQNAAELWQIYGGQIAMYKRALQEATGVPVRQAVLYSLSLGVAAPQPVES